MLTPYDTTIPDLDLSPWRRANPCLSPSTLLTLALAPISLLLTGLWLLS